MALERRGKEVAPAWKCSVRCQAARPGTNRTPTAVGRERALPDRNANIKRQIETDTFVIYSCSKIFPPTFSLPWSDSAGFTSAKERYCHIFLARVNN